MINLIRLAIRACLPFSLCLPIISSALVDDKDAVDQFAFVTGQSITSINIEAEYYDPETHSQLTKLNSERGQYYVIDNPIMTIYQNCQTNTASMVVFKIGRDKGNLKRYSPFHKLTTIDQNCRQKMTSTYPISASNGIQYDRGHFAQQNLFDNDKQAQKFSNYFVNISPQEANFNRWGSWRQSEKLVECLRDEFQITVISGPIYTSKSERYFIKSHNVFVPTAFYKILTGVRNGKPISMVLIMPNMGGTSTSIAGLVNYYSTVPQIEQLTGLKMPVTVKNMNNPNDWYLPETCGWS